MRKNRKPLYLNREILLLAMIGYAACLILLLLMDYSLIQRHMNEVVEKQQEALDSYIEEIEAAMTDIDLQLYSVYQDDNNFEALSAETDFVTEYGYAYELRKSLRTRMLNNENWNGLYLYYGGFARSWYFTSGIEWEYSIRLNRIMLAQLQDAVTMRSWITVNMDDRVWLVIPYLNERAAVYGVIDLSDADELLAERMGSEAEVVLVEAGKGYGNEELVERLSLDTMAENSADSFEVRTKGYQVFGARITNTNLWVCAARKLDIWSFMTVWQLMLLVITATSALAVGMLYYYLRREVVVPIRRLTGRMEAIRKGEREEAGSCGCGSRFMELQEMDSTLTQMVQELDAQKLLAYEETIEKQKAQMQYLCLQLNPHFYLNGLKTLNAMVADDNKEEMRELIQELSVHLRYLLRAEQEMVPLSREIEFVRNYVDMQKHVSGRPVVCQIRQDEDTDDWMVPTLSIQTFVENSVKYAKLGGSTILLQIRVTVSILTMEEENYLDIIVEDNGGGYPEEILKMLNSDISAGNLETSGRKPERPVEDSEGSGKNPESPGRKPEGPGENPKISGRNPEISVSRGGVGIINILRRCRILYGEKMEYTFDNADGAFSELVLPQRRAEDERAVSG